MTTYRTNKDAKQAERFEVFVSVPLRRLEGRYNPNQLELVWPDLVATYGEAALSVERLK